MCRMILRERERELESKIEKKPRAANTQVNKVS